jgi:hypothetical protein
MASGFPSLICDDQARRGLIAESAALNGIDYVEVVTAPPAVDQMVLLVFFLEKDQSVAGAQASLDNLLTAIAASPTEVTIQGGVRIKGIQVTSVAVENGHLRVGVSEPGDFSEYTLAINDPGLDQAYAQVNFSFKAGCPSPFDCKPVTACPPEPLVEPIIDYLAKDYASFRQALIDYIPTLIPAWTERHEADIGIMLLELLAYIGDDLSYYQDAVANEAFLGSARQRISVRRMVRLIDYTIGDGVSARAFVHLALTADTTGFLPAGTPVLSRITVQLADELPPQPAVLAAKYKVPAEAAAAATFETQVDANLSSQLNQIFLHAWGDKQCCLPKGATTVDLEGDLAYDPSTDKSNPWKLKPGDFLLFEEVLGPDTGLAADADPTHRQIVRLRTVQKTFDFLEPDPSTGNPPMTVTRVTWDITDALTFPVCLSVKLSSDTYVDHVSVARGNLVLADHGRTISEWYPADPVDPNAQGIVNGPRAFRFFLQNGPLSFRILLDDLNHPPNPFIDRANPETVSQLTVSDPVLATPQVGLEIQTRVTPPGQWLPVTDLLESSSSSPAFVPETDNNGRALIRFGDGQYGIKPLDGSFINATYRVGVGVVGNVGAESLAHIINPGTVLNFPSVVTVRNPLPAWGGTDPQPLAQIRQLAPAAFRAVQYRAVTEEDYANAAKLVPGVANAVATFRWTGSWYTVFISVDPLGTNTLSSALQTRVLTWVTGYTQAGYDLEITPPIFVALQVVIHVCVDPYYFRFDVEQALLAALSNQILPDGSKGFFYPGNFTFAQSLFLSQLYAAVMAVAGVASAVVTTFQRYGKVANNELQQGYAPAGRLEILRLDNDPNFPENGSLTLNMDGGK